MTMAFVDWRMHGSEITNCNCATGCPCQFNALPTHGDCRAYVFMQIDRGHFGQTKLDGVRWGALFAWPGPIHLGNGEAMVVIDENTTPEQRAAIETVASGKETEPGSLITQVFSTTLTKGHPTQVKPIDLTIDETAGTARVRVAGLIDMSCEPIKNPVTGAPHRARVTLPKGFEYTEAEYISGTGKATGPIELDFARTHAHIAKLHWSQNGVVR
jgi:hypothetical protein